MIRIQLVKSVLGRPPRIRKTVKALGLKRLNSVVTFKKSNPALEGMIVCAESILKVERLK